MRRRDPDDPTVDYETMWEDQQEQRWRIRIPHTEWAGVEPPEEPAK